MSYLYVEYTGYGFGDSGDGSCFEIHLAGEDGQDLIVSLDNEEARILCDDIQRHYRLLDAIEAK